METEVGPALIAAMCVAALVVGLSKGGLPGLGPLVTIIVALAVPAPVAIGVVLPLLMLGDAIALWALWPHVDRAIAGPVVAGAVGGVAVASIFLASLSPDALEGGIVVVVMAFVVYRSAVLSGFRSDAAGTDFLGGGRAGAVAGAAAGVTSTIAHAGGPPVAIHLLARQLPPLTFAGTSAAIFWAVNWLKVPGYAAAGLFDGTLLVSLAPTAILIAPGVLIGRWAARRINPRPFELLILVGLAAGAVLLLVT